MAYVFQDKNFMCIRQILNLMCDKKHSLVFQITINALVKQMATNVSIDSR
jgi:hypothetical protein